MIGVFDSGVGGLSVLTGIRKLLPDADLLYVADRARAPYGVRDLADVRRISHLVADWLLGQGADCLVIACNTASAAALNSIREDHPGLVVVGMEPAVKPAAAVTTTGKVAVFATAATFQGELFDSVMTRFATGVDVMTVACPEWVTIVERGHIEDPKTDQAVEARVRPAVEAGADTIVLGCTHFSFLGEAIQRLGGVSVVDPSPAVAARVAEVAPNSNGAGRTTLAVSGPIEGFAKLARRIGGIDADVIRFAP